MKDFLGRECVVGDTVAFMKLGYRSMLLGTIVRITPKMVFLECEKRWGLSGTEVIKQFHDQVVKVTEHPL